MARGLWHHIHSPFALNMHARTHAGGRPSVPVHQCTATQRQSHPQGSSGAGDDPRGGSQDLRERQPNTGGESRTQKPQLQRYYRDEPPRGPEVPQLRRGQHAKQLLPARGTYPKPKAQPRESGDPEEGVSEEARLVRFIERPTQGKKMTDIAFDKSLVQPHLCVSHSLSGAAIFVYRFT